jgi:predicted tellurium resistance membrane protein TerC
MVDQVSVMILAVVLTTIIMIVFAAGISSFMERYGDEGGSLRRRI